MRRHGGKVGVPARQVLLPHRTEQNTVNTIGGKLRQIASRNAGSYGLRDVVDAHRSESCPHRPQLGERDEGSAMRKYLR